MMLDDPTRLAAVDPHGARQVLSAFGQQCRQAAALGLSPAISLPRPRIVVVAGMGGSAAG